MGPDTKGETKMLQINPGAGREPPKRNSKAQIINRLVDDLRENSLSDIQEMSLRRDLNRVSLLTLWTLIYKK